MPQLLTADHIDPDQLADFLRRMYPPLKAEFLIRHGAWWHGSDANRLIILDDDGQLAGYCGVIPARVWVEGEVRPALWWVDLMIAPEFRGRGLQSLFDQRVKGMADLLLGFPNELAAKIHRKHGWGVREDMRTLLLPLQPTRLRPVLGAHGIRGVALRLVAWLFTPLATSWQYWLASRKPQNVHQMPAFDPNLLAGIFARSCQEGIITTIRDTEYFDWRYGGAPRLEDYHFFLAGPPEAPTHYLITRYIAKTDRPAHTRILDIYGDFNDTAALSALITLAIQNSIARGASQVIMLASIAEIRRVARRLGFVFSVPGRFCWLGEPDACMSALAGENHWTLGDSDNDSPE